MSCPEGRGQPHRRRNAGHQACIKEWRRKDAIPKILLFRRIPESIIFHLFDYLKMAKRRWDGLTEVLGQPAFKDSRKEE
jgi:hypothetical protein